ncbi:MAG: NIL domain-containing protein [Chloroflexota bacterium]
MASHTVRLIYPPSLLRVPVINQLVRRFDLTVNIVHAQIDKQQGWIELQLSGENVTIEEAIVWLRGKGLEVESVEKQHEHVE